ncbi:MAG: hypothetical protein ILA52_01425 [Alphaproteobacteria bacterium]|nr:hypothetical protein [Alphaproteobacteria bacterium]
MLVKVEKIKLMSQLTVDIVYNKLFSHDYLTLEEECEMFGNPEIKEFFLNTLNMFKPLSVQAEAILLRSSLEPGELSRYIELKGLKPENQILMFSLPTAKSLIRSFIIKHKLSDQAEVCLLDFADKSLTAHYIHKWMLSPLAQTHIFKLPDAKEIFMQFIQEWPLSSQAEQEMFNQPYGIEILFLYIRRYRLHAESEPKFFALPGASQHIDYYVHKHGLHCETMSLLLKKIYA